METKEIFGNAAKTATTVAKTATKTATKAATKASTKATEAKTAVKKAATKATEKKELKKEIFIQFQDKQVDEEAVVKKVNADLKTQKVKATDLKLYIKPEENACYYVANGKVAGKVDLF